LTAAGDTESLAAISLLVMRHASRRRDRRR